jgi:AraC family transcriptional regulator
MQALDILKSNQSTGVEAGLNLLQVKQQQIPGAAQYTVRRYSAPDQMTEDTGMMVYHYNPSTPTENYLELRFCAAVNRYCNAKDCSNCADKSADNCPNKQATLDLFNFHFTSTFLHQYVHNIKLNNRKDEVLAFRHPHSFTKIFPVCSRKRLTLNGLLAHNYNGALENIFMNAKVHELLLYSLECLVDEKEEGFACKFLADEAGRNRIYQAREILLQHIGDPITIKELSRKVAMNECYLKKGFKEIFGTTIFDFYQQQRMEHAKYLLYEKGLSVTDVSALLGYSSISHFSAAFKKHTGIKPCELLR